MEHISRAGDSRKATNEVAARRVTCLAHSGPSNFLLFGEGVGSLEGRLNDGKAQVI